MDIASFIDVQKCVFQVAVKLIVIKGKVANEMVYNITVYNDDNLTDRMKISLFNVNNEQESYTCILDRDKFNILKNEQDLVINYDQFCDEFRILLEPHETTMQIKLKIDGEIKLGFYAISHLKLLTMLEIPFLSTSPNEIINNFKKQIDELKAEKTALENTVAELRTENEVARAMCEDRDAVYARLMTCQTQLTNQNDAEAREEVLESENKKLCQMLRTANADKFTHLNELETCRQMNFAQSEKLTENTRDINELRNGIDYYVAKVGELNQMVELRDCVLQNMVPNDKYQELSMRFSSAIADLVIKTHTIKDLMATYEQINREKLVMQDEMEKYMVTLNKILAIRKRKLALKQEAGQHQGAAIKQEAADIINSEIISSDSEDDDDMHNPIYRAGNAGEDVTEMLKRFNY